METISSRTPEGMPGRCPVCKNDVALQPSEPLGDAPCPSCGVLLWPFDTDQGQYFFAADEVPMERRQPILEILRAFAEPDLDSLDRVELLMELEEELEVVIPDDVAENWTSVQDFINWLRSREP